MMRKARRRVSMMGKAHRGGDAQGAQFSRLVAEGLNTRDLRKLGKVRKSSKLHSPPPKINFFLILAKDAEK